MNKWIKVAAWALILALVAVLMLAPTVSSDEVQILASKYSTFTLYEDGSYRGTDLNARVVTGCIEGRLCDEN